MTSEIKVNKVSDSCGSALVTKCGSTITLGASGKTVAIACGATTSGMGRTGTVDWCTTAKTSPFTGVSGKGYFINTTSGAVTITLPASPSAGDIIAVKDYANTWDTNGVTLGRNGSKICGIAEDSLLSTESQSVTLIYVDSTKGWQDIHDSTANVQGNPGFISATGGTVTECGDFKIHTFTSDGCFAVTNTFGSGVGAKVSYVVVAGGGGSGGDTGGGGGAGGFREGKQACGGYTASPLAATPCSGLTITTQTTYPITVGAGGASGCSPTSYKGCSGSNSVFSTITSTGGGGGGGGNTSPAYGGRDGGSGGGGARSGGTGGSGNTPPVSPSQGFNGGNGQPGGNCTTGGGGGGATAVGGPGNVAPGPTSGYSNGGAGAGTNINTATGESGPGPSRYYSGGGAGGVRGTNSPNSGVGGIGGGGNSSPGAPTPTQAGTTNTGGGGGSNCGAGGSGVVIIRYKFQ